MEKSEILLLLPNSLKFDISTSIDGCTPDLTTKQFVVVINQDVTCRLGLQCKDDITISLQVPRKAASTFFNYLQKSAVADFSDYQLINAEDFVANPAVPAPSDTPSDDTRMTSNTDSPQIKLEQLSYEEFERSLNATTNVTVPVTKKGSKTKECPKCTKVFASSKSLRRHLMIHSGEKPFKCSLCEKRFITRYKCRRHELVHARKTNYRCQYCTKSFSQRSQFVAHERLCKLTSRSMPKLKLHSYTDVKSDETLKMQDYDALTEVEEDEEVVDEVQETATAEEEDGRRRSKRKSSKPRKTLPMMFDGAASPDHMSQDEAFEQLVKKKKSDSLYPPKKTLPAEKKCKICGKEFNRPHHLQRHMVTHSADKPFVCNTCGKAFRRLDKCRAHERIHVRPEKFTCEKCNRIFKCYTPYMRHLQLCGSETSSQDKSKSPNANIPVPCPMCNKIMSNKYNLKEHLRLHTGEKPFQCTYCGQSFAGKSALAKHENRHQGQRTYPCNMCDKVCYEKSNLARHMLMHSGEKPFQCTYCGQKFAEIHKCREHERIHTGEKPFPCSICPAKFCRKTNLTVHMRIHTGEMPYECPACEKRFREKRSRDRHTETHPNYEQLRVAFPYITEHKVKVSPKKCTSPNKGTEPSSTNSPTTPTTSQQWLPPHNMSSSSANAQPRLPTPDPPMYSATDPMALALHINQFANPMNLLPLSALAMTDQSQDDGKYGSCGPRDGGAMNNMSGQGSSSMQGPPITEAHNFSNSVLGQAMFNAGISGFHQGCFEPENPTYFRF